jgi:hypothetical protein
MSDIYPSARDLAATTGVNWLTWDIRAVLVDVGYVYDEAHDFLSDVGAGTRVDTSTALTGKTVANGGVCDANDVSFTALTGDTVTGIIVYHHTGVESTSDLLVWYDRQSTGGLISYSPSGLDATVRWNNSATKMFKL